MIFAGKIAKICLESIRKFVLAHDLRLKARFEGYFFVGGRSPLTKKYLPESGFSRKTRRSGTTPL